MGAEERANKALTQAQIAEYERTVGPVVDFGTYFDGCPACGARDRKMQWCLGDGSVSLKFPCPIQGQHHHVFCGNCGFAWNMKLRSDPTNAKRLDTQIEQLILILKREVADHAGSTHYSADDLEAVREAQLKMDTHDDGGLTLRLERPAGAPPPIAA